MRKDSNSKMIFAPVQQGRSVWSPGFIGTVCIKNRVLRSAVNDSQADPDGNCTPVHIALYRELAAGGLGALITGHIYVHKSGMAGNRQLGIDREQHVAGLSRLTEVVHQENGVIFAQLAHAGSQADIYLTGNAPSGPSVHLTPEGVMRSALSLNEIAIIIEAFVQAARRAKKAGFDGIQVHAAHGYLLSEFLSPALNKRIDGYGGSLENRARLLMEICSGIREEVGADYPLLVKMDSEEFAVNGMTSEMMRSTARLLEQAKLVDAVEISGLRARHRKENSDGTNPGTRAYAYIAAKEFKNELTLPTILVGGIDSLATARFLIENQVADFVAMARPLIRKPFLVAQWWQQDQGKI